MIVRFLATCAFIYFSYYSKTKGNNNSAILYLILAVLFQPFFKIALGRQIWNLVDIIVATGLIISIFWKFKNNTTSG